MVGGGLASIDVVKVLMLETTRAKLAERGIEPSDARARGEGHPEDPRGATGSRFEELGLARLHALLPAPRRGHAARGGARRRDARAPARRCEGARAACSRRRWRSTASSVEPLAAPDGLLVEGDRLVGLRFRRTRMEGGKLVATDETFERRGPYVISSIGSIPEPIPGDPDEGRAVRLHRLGHRAPRRLPDGVLGRQRGDRQGQHRRVAQARRARERGRDRALPRRRARTGTRARRRSPRPRRAAAREEAERVADQLDAQPPLPAERAAALVERVRARQRAVGYGGDYRAWIEKVTPPDLE